MISQNLLDLLDRVAERLDPTPTLQERLNKIEGIANKAFDRLDGAHSDECDSPYHEVIAEMERIAQEREECTPTDLRRWAHVLTIAKRDVTEALEALGEIKREFDR